jgi:hypothetical protein
MRLLRHLLRYCTVMLNMIAILNDRDGICVTPENPRKWVSVYSIFHKVSEQRVHTARTFVALKPANMTYGITTVFVKW